MTRNLLLGVVSLAIAVLASEVALRATGMFQPEPRLYPGDKPVGTYAHTDTLIGWKLPQSTSTPHRPKHGDFDVTYVSNAQGFRAESDYDSPSSRPGEKIAFLGDSFTLGVGVEQDSTFVRRVERQLDGATAFNFGMSGFGVDQMWLTLLHYARQVRPDIVVVSFVFDDLNRTMSAYRLRDTLQYRRSRGEVGWVPKPAFDLEDGQIVRLDETRSPGALSRFITDNSRLLEGGRRIQNRLSYRYPIGRRWSLNRAIFTAIAQVCEEMPSRLLIVYLPAKGLEQRAAPLFAEEMAELGIEYLDLQPLLPDEFRSLYFDHDRHFNAAGHDFVARQISARLVELGWAQATETAIAADS